MFRPLRVAPRAPAAHYVTRASMRPSVPLRAPLHTATAGAARLSMPSMGARRTLTTASPPPAAPAPDAPAAGAAPAADPAAAPAAPDAAASGPRKSKSPRPPMSTAPADTLVKHAANKAAAIGPKSAKQQHASKHKARFPRNAVWRPASETRKPAVLSRPRERAPPEVYENSLQMMEMLKAKKFDDALFFVKKLEEFGPPPNTVMYNALIHALSTNERMADAMRMLADLEAHPTRRPDAPIYNSIMTKLVKDAQHDAAYELFERMRANFVMPDEITFSILLNASKKAEQLEKFGHWLKTMQRFGIPPTVVHYNIMMDGYAKAAAIDKMQELLIEMQKNSIPPSEFIYSSLITVFARLGMVQKIMDTYRFAKADGAANSVVLTQVMQIALQHKKQDVANEIFLYMKENSIPFNSRVASIVSAQLGRTTTDPGKTRALVDHVAATGADSIHVRTSHLAHLFRSGDVAKAKEFFAALLKDGPAPTLQTFNAYLHGVLTQPDAQSNELSEVLALMQERGVEPDTVTFSVVIKYYVGKGDEGLAAATRLIQSLEERDDLGKNIQQCYGPLVSFYFRTNKPEMAQAIYERVISRFTPTIVLQRTMFYGFLKRDDPVTAERYLPIMNVQMRNELVERYLRRGMLSRAAELRKRISDEMARAREAAAAKVKFAAGGAEKTEKDAEAAEAAAWDEATKLARLREAVDINKV